MTERASPVGREQVRSALLRAATALLAERGPRATSIREIAQRARVNHGLVHRHFGSKDELVKAVLDRLLDRLRGEASESTLSPSTFGPLLASLADNPRGWRLLARAVLDGHTGAFLRGEFPVVQGAVRAVAAAQDRGEVDPELDARELVATAVALSLGWLLFEPFIAAATGLRGDSSARRRERIVELWKSLAKRAVCAPASPGART